METPTLPARRFAWTQRIAALAIVFFWISFWNDHHDLPANVVDFEWCFLLPDILWIVGTFWLASHWLIKSDPRAAIATAVAGSSMVYLGMLDAICNFRHGQYTGFAFAGRSECTRQYRVPVVWERKHLVRQRA